MGDKWWTLPFWRSSSAQSKSSDGFLPRVSPEGRPDTDEEDEEGTTSPSTPGTPFERELTPTKYRIDSKGSLRQDVSWAHSTSLSTFQTESLESFSCEGVPEGEVEKVCAQEVDEEETQTPIVQETAVFTLSPEETLVPPPLPPPDWEETPSTPPTPSRPHTPSPAALQIKSVSKKHLGKAFSTVKKWWSVAEESTRPHKLTRILSEPFLLQGQSGFEDLRRYIKQGGDFCKELAVILHERSEAETQYGKILSKLSTKLMKTTKENSGTINSAWHRIAMEMEAQSEIHRAFAAAMSEEIVKPLRQLSESQHRVRKAVENAVDKSGKNLSEWRSAELKAKKTSFTCARDNEKLRSPPAEGRSRLSTSSLHLHKSPDKEAAKLESKRKKAEECVKKADVEYYNVCLRGERARLEWESAVLRGSNTFQILEEERLQGLKDFAHIYQAKYNVIGPAITQISNRLGEPINQCNVTQDLDKLLTLKSATQPSREQHLPDFYAEHSNLAMNKERRREALVKLLQLIRLDLEREKRGKAGVENLARALKQTPNFASEDSQQNVVDKLYHMRSMLTYLEAARYKVQMALWEVEGKAKESHPLSPHIHVSRDRQGYQQTILKVPSWIHNEIEPSDISDWIDRGMADGTSVQPDSDFDEFSSQGSEKEYEMSVIQVPEVAPLKCKALYSYTANLYDELNLSPGDIINIHDKQPDGWWLGELNGVVGIFPATYVEELK